MNYITSITNRSHNDPFRLVLFLYLLALGFFPGCGGGEEDSLSSAGVSGGDPILVALSIESDTLVLAGGTTTNLDVSGLYSDGSRGAVVGA